MSKRRARPPDEQPGGTPPPERPRIPELSSRHRRTLESIFETPTQPDIQWRRIEALFRALGGEVTEGSGSRVRVALNGVRAVFHEPHPEKVTDRRAVVDVRDFLERAGVRP